MTKQLKRPSTAQTNHGMDAAEKLSRLRYIEEMLVELRSLSDGLGEPTLNYLIAMACMEAQQKSELQDFQDAIE